MVRGKRAVLPLATVATAAGIFILDTLTNPEIAVGVLYVAVVLLAVRFLDPRGVLLAAAGCVALVVVSRLVTPYGEFSVNAFVNLLIVTAAIAITTYLALRNRAAEEAFENELESRVEARSREVLEVNRQLRSQIEQREKAEALVGQLQRFDAIGQITSGIAHDFNNLLSVVLTNARLLSRQLLEPDDQEGVDLIRAAAERGTKLTAQLLAFAREQRLEPQIVDLNQKVAGMRDLLAATLGDTVQLRALLHPQLWPALADPTQLEMIILNLAINGRDAMPSGGSMTIETFNTVIGDQPVRPEDPETGEYVGLAIRDTGTGIPEHALARAFEPFFTTKRRGKGSGLGLAQVFGFAKQSGGGVRIETRVGEGTCVKVFLPRADVDPAS